MEHLTSVKVTIEVHTNRRTIREDLELQEDETTKTFLQRLKNRITIILIEFK